MSFFDDLKKPEQKPAPAKLEVFTDAQRQKIVELLCLRIRLECTSAKKNGKRSFHGYCEWSNSETYDSDGDRYRRLDASVRKSFNTRGQGRGELNPYCNQAERDRILPLLRKALRADGFPADVLRPYEYNNGNFLNPKMIYSIEVNVNW